MGISDMVVGNLTTLYLVAIAAVKAHGLLSGQGFGSFFALAVSTAAVGFILIGSVIWDVSRKTAAEAVTPDGGGTEVCRGGICWHGVAVRSPAANLRFRLPQQRSHNLP
ncbi:hypothetical protein U1Q18_005992 [Sarracenia purpurea var. burkii]